MGTLPREHEGSAGGAKGCEGVGSQMHIWQRKGGTGQTSQGGLGGVAKSSLYCTTWEFGGETSQKCLRCCQAQAFTGVTMAYVLSSETSHVMPGPPLSAEGEPANLIDASSPVQLYRTA